MTGADPFTEQPAIGAAPSPQKGTDGLDDLLSEFEASTRGNSASQSTSNGTSAPSQGAFKDDASELEGVLNADRTFLDDYVDPNSTYWRDRQQAAFAHSATEQAQRVIEQARQEQQRLADARDAQDTEVLLKEIRGDLDPKVYDDKAVRAFIIEQHLEDGSLKEIFDNRANNPRAYEGLRRQLMREFSRRASSRPDPDLSEDRDAVAAAVRGASVNRAPDNPAPNYARASNTEFRNDVRDRYGFDPGV